MIDHDAPECCEDCCCVLTRATGSHVEDEEWGTYYVCDECFWLRRRPLAPATRPDGGRSFADDDLPF